MTSIRPFVCKYIREYSENVVKIYFIDKIVIKYGSWKLEVKGKI